MRYRRLLGRFRNAMLLGAAAMLVFYVGRLSVRRVGVDLLLCGIWAGNGTYWLREIRRQLRRDHEEFQAEMRKVAEEIARKQLMEEE